MNVVGTLQAYAIAYKQVMRVYDILQKTGETNISLSYQLKSI